MASTDPNPWSGPPAPSGRLVPLTHVPDLDGYAWISTRWLRRRVYENGLPHYKIGGRLFVDLDELDRLVADGARRYEARR
jgi:hypothetical protein